MTNYETLEAECIHQFGIALRKADCRGSFIKLTWLRDLKERLQLNDQLSIERYEIISWSFACLVHLYRALCKASRFDCKEIDGPLTSLLSWA
ncbi:hypothetical protein Ahy_B09g098272 [Arachis hypogaea]|uniref:Aminotransferase-like plant mobile domain-containing protein n=1 Tax=Arachis hypogaea TaxID=3818 RepID=A0A444XQX5_ARAHY|nr:hypothetical protein Ahy_B09g098272 [Arachis hypogaea]